MKRLLFLCALPAALPACADVWRDAAAVYSGNAVNLAEGYLDTSSVRDVRHAADATAQTHGSRWISAWTTGYRTVTMERSDVYCATAGATLPDQSVIHFNPTVDGDGKISGEVLELNAQIATNKYTAVYRFKMDVSQPRDGVLWLLNLGYSWPNCGAAIQCDTANDKLNVVWGSASVLDFSDILPDGKIADWLGNWVELAVIVDGASITVGAAAPGSPMRWKTGTGSWFGERLAPGCLPRIGGYTSVNWASSDGSHFSARQSYHLAAFWNRPLSKNEVLEALAAPRQELWRLGGDGYGHEMFAGTSGATVSADLQSSPEIPSELSAGGSFSIQFSIPAEKRRRPHLLKIVPVAAVTDATLAFSLDGAALTGAKVDSSGRWTVYVPGLGLTQGSHALSVSRTDSESAAMSFDTIAMTARSDVWSDALAVYSGNATNETSLGCLDVSSIKDVRRAGVADASTHGAAWGANWTAGKQGVSMIKSDVVCGASGRMLADQDVLFFASPTNSDGKIASECVVFPVDITTNRYTAIFRFRLAETQPRDGAIWLLNMGYSWPTRGLAVQCNPSNGKLNVVWGSASVLDFSSIVPDGELANWFGSWVEMAIIVDGQSLTVGAARAGEPMRWRTESADWFGAGLTPGNRPRIGGYSAVTWYETDGSYFGASAAYHLAAYWDRPLTKDEATSALASPVPGLWRLGAEAYGGEMFAGESGAELYALPQQTSKVPPRLASGQSFTVRFVIPQELAGRAQVVRIVPSSAVASASFELTLDGTVLPEPLASADGDRTTLARGSLLGAGEHTLAVRRTDSGAAPVSLDLVEMTGSFRHGLADGTMNEFAGNAGVSTYNFSWGDLKRVRSHTSPSHPLTLVYDLPASVSGKYRFSFSMKPSWRNGTFNLPIDVNGTTMDTWLIDSDAVHTTKIGTGILEDGENTIYLQPGSHYNIDYIDIDIVSEISSGSVILFL